MWVDHDDAIAQVMETLPEGHWLQRAVYDAASDGCVEIDTRAIIVSALDIDRRHLPHDEDVLCWLKGMRDPGECEAQAIEMERRTDDRDQQMCGYEEQRLRVSDHRGIGARSSATRGPLVRKRWMREGWNPVRETLPACKQWTPTKAPKRWKTTL